MKGDLMKLLFSFIACTLLFCCVVMADAGLALEQAAGVLDANKGWLAVAMAVLIELVARYMKTANPQGWLQWFAKLCRGLAAFAAMLADLSDMVLKQKLKE